MTRQLE